MLYALPGPLAAAPLLHLTLARVARTPRARLAVGARICSGEPAGPVERLAPCRRSPPQHAGEYVALVGAEWTHAQFQLRRNLGQALARDTILAGIDVGEVVPLANLCCEARLRQAGACGAMLDVTV